MSYVARRWRIPAEELQRMKLPRDGAQAFMRRIGVNTDRPFETMQSYEYDATLLKQTVWIDGEDGLTPLEREILKSIIPDEDMWVHEPIVGRGGQGSKFCVTVTPDFSVFPSEICSPFLSVKSLDVNELRLSRNFEFASLLVAIDEDSLEIYWSRKTP